MSLPYRFKCTDPLVVYTHDMEVAQEIVSMLRFWKLVPDICDPQPTMGPGYGKLEILPKVLLTASSTPESKDDVLESWGDFKAKHLMDRRKIRAWVMTPDNRVGQIRDVTHTSVEVEYPGTPVTQSFRKSDLRCLDTNFKPGDLVRCSAVSLAGWVSNPGSHVEVRVLEVDEQREQVLVQYRNTDSIWVGSEYCWRDATTSAVPEFRAGDWVVFDDGETPRFAVVGSVLKTYVSCRPVSNFRTLPRSKVRPTPKDFRLGDLVAWSKDLNNYRVTALGAGKVTLSSTSFDSPDPGEVRAEACRLLGRNPGNE